jgi:ribosome-associated protein
MIDNAAAQRLDEQHEENERIETTVRLAADAAWEKKALGLRVIDVRGRVSYADFIIICSGNSDRQVNAIAEGVQRTLRDAGVRPMGVEGKDGQWVLLDYGDFVVHVFTEASRDVYGLDSLWVNAPELPLDAPPELERPAYY